MKSTTKVLAVLLLAMVIALLPGIDMTVYAAEAHSISTISIITLSIIMINCGSPPMLL